ncbi:MAG TPA: rhodanese-like domain-containing protein [Spirochaetia bacterium]|nr:sulfurtransferase [Spirochaetaceae bacterium]HPE88838.1 rhodanese-like domain-containing protein [Spirochaetales bacterium]HRW24309.1 rhodanese-like domain-containing protein [Spirochaetia bacterium]
MKKAILILLAVALVAPAFARDVDAIVDVAWLEANLSKPGLVIVDVRKIDEYKAGHVPGAVNLLGMYVAKDGKSNEVPEADDLSEIIAEAGIDEKSTVVVVESGGARFAWATRVAWTLVYAGVPNVTILDGGYEEWVKAGKAVTTGFESKDETDFQVKFVDSYLATEDYLVKNVKKAQIVDTRAYDTYFGVSKQAFVEQYGHIPGAYSLPAAWITVNGLVRPKAELEALVAGLKLSPKKDTIVHCDSGVLATAWWWILTQQLGWTKVGSHDGSAQEISRDPSVTFVKGVWR